MSMAYSSTFPKGEAELRVYVDGRLATGGNITLNNSVPSKAPASVVLAAGLAASKSQITNQNGFEMCFAPNQNASRIQYKPS